MRIVFAVVGHTAVGLGHVHRVMTLAHELAGHDLAVVCTRESVLAAERLAGTGLRTSVQDDLDLGQTVLSLHPDLVINDILDTEVGYVEGLKESGAVVVNFEDLGPGADAADLTINAIYHESGSGPRRLEGPDYFCIRDEFLKTSPKPFSDRVRDVLVTFGGTDLPNSTRRVVDLILPPARERGIHISVVTGAGYCYSDELREFLAGVSERDVTLSSATDAISRHMARADLAFSSAGRTVFELAAMRVPGIIIASNPREEIHTFARERNGMRFLGRQDTVRDSDIFEAFVDLVESRQRRLALRARTEQWDFRLGRERVVGAITALLHERVPR